MACFCCRRINTTTSLVVLFHLPRAERFVRHALLAEPTFLDLRRGCSFYPSLGNSEEMVNSTLPCPIGIDSPLCLLSQHTWRRILPRRCHLDRRRGGCCPATATGANPHHFRRRPERLNCFRPSPFSARPVLPFVSTLVLRRSLYPPRACSRTECVLGMELSLPSPPFFFQDSR